MAASIPSLFTNSQQWLARYNDGYCSLGTFTGVTLPNIEVISLTAEPYDNVTYKYPAFAPPNPDITDLNYCNVTITYNHPGWNDTVTANVFLPTQNWNGRYQAAGGSGFAAGGADTLFISGMSGVAEGFAVSSTDGGHGSGLALQAGVDIGWALTSVGNINWPSMVDFSYQALHEAVQLAKLTIPKFYGQPPKYSYWYGGSQGGRQGYMYAQRYPKDFCGIIALFPAIEWTELMSLLAWPSVVMNLNKVYPPPCETAAISAAAIEACDPLDGVIDGLISRPDLCTFDPYSVVGKNISCEGTPSTISQGSALVVQETWEGPSYSTGKRFARGLLRGTDISTASGTAYTSCVVNNSTGTQTCTPAPVPLGPAWYSTFVLKNYNGSLPQNLTFQQWDQLIRDSHQEYDSLLETGDPDLSLFKEAGGKLLTWHGLADPLISANTTIDYYNQVRALDPKLDEFYRLFLMPGGVHTNIGPIQVPNIRSYIVDWVEKGIAPAVLRADGTDPNGNPYSRDLCRYPQVQHFVGGDSTNPGAFKCV